MRLIVVDLTIEEAADPRVLHNIINTVGPCAVPPFIRYEDRPDVGADLPQPPATDNPIVVKGPLPPLVSVAPPAPMPSAAEVFGGLTTRQKTDAALAEVFGAFVAGGAPIPAPPVAATPIAVPAPFAPAQAPSMPAPPAAAAVPLSTAPVAATPSSIATVPVPPSPAATLVPPVPAAPTASPASPAGIELDARGLPWDHRIHTSTKTKNKDGSWRQKRETPPELVESVEAELRAALGLPPVVSNVPAPPAGPVLPTSVVGTAVAPQPQADAPAQFGSLMVKVQEATMAGQIASNWITDRIRAHGLETLPTLMLRQDITQAVWDELRQVAPRVFTA